MRSDYFPAQEEEVQQNVGSLRDLEDALAELAVQNEQLEEDCKDLEAHCRDLERLGYPSPCPVEQLLVEVAPETPAMPVVATPVTGSVEATPVLTASNGQAWG